AGSKHVQVTATTLFGIRQGHSENLREYLARAKKATQKKEAETQGKNPKIGDRHSGTSEEEISGTTGTKARTVDDHTNIHGTAAKEPT
ncbi:hypothetical protein A2U01_0032095, partial [Trifolium medium]|nr:hypothetical protein [Trifolium medium]